MWYRQVAALRDDHHLLVPDLPGHGRSRDVAWASLADTAGEIAEVIKNHARERRAHLVGLSLGGFVAYHLARDYPEVVETVIVTGMNTMPAPRPRFATAMGVASLPFAALGPMVRAHARRLRMPASDVDGYVEAARTVSKGAYLRSDNELMRFQLSRTPLPFTGPALVIAGIDETDLVKSSVTPLTSVFPAGISRLAPGGHGWNLEYPAVFNATVRAHVAGAPLPTDLRRLSPGD